MVREKKKSGWFLCREVEGTGDFLRCQEWNDLSRARLRAFRRGEGTRGRPLILHFHLIELRRMLAAGRQELRFNALGLGQAFQKENSLQKKF